MPLFLLELAIALADSWHADLEPLGVLANIGLSRKKQKHTSKVLLN